MRNVRAAAALASAVLVLPVTASMVLSEPLFPFSFLGVQLGGIATGDFNEDQHPDFATLTPGGVNVGVFLNRGDATFAGGVMVPNPLAMAPLVAGDFNGDGHLDLALYQAFSPAVSLSFGAGDGTFGVLTTPVPIHRMPGLLELLSADFNGDGRDDLAAIDSTSGLGIQVLLSQGDGTFLIGHAGTVSNPQNIVQGDFNGDTVPDLAVQGDLDPSSGFVAGFAALLGTGDGTFSQVNVPMAVTGNSMKIAAGDVNGDGLDDIAISRRFDQSVSVFLGSPSGGFSSGGGLGGLPNPYNIAIGDLDGDGDGDLAFVYVEDLVNTIVNTGFLMNVGSGVFVQGSVMPSGDTKYKFIDFNADGHLDLLAGVGTLILGNGDGTFVSRSRTFTAQCPRAAASVDFNADGKVDVATAGFCSPSGTIVVGFGDGAGGFPSILSLQANEEVSSIIAGDFNGDLRQDIAVTNLRSDDVSIYLGNGDGEPTAPGRFVVGDGPVDLVGSDLNGDGALDLAVVNSLAGDVSILLGKGDGYFLPQSRVTAGASPSALTAADLNDDGHVDIAVANTAGDDLSVYLGAGDGTFPTEARLPAADGPYAIEAADFDGDGLRDLAVGTLNSQEVILFYARPGALPEAGPRRKVIGAVSQLGVDDFNHDGRPDVFLCCGTGLGHIAVLLQKDGGLEPEGRYYTGSSVLAAGDFNGDGAVDLFGAGDHEATVLLNQLPPQRVEDIVLRFNVPQGQGSATLGWRTNGELDLEGFNIVVFDNRGQRVQLNAVIVPCTQCITGLPDAYMYPIPKHRGGRDMFVEMVHANGAVEIFGPAVRQ